MSSIFIRMQEGMTRADLLYGIYLFGRVVYDTELLRRLIPEELMQESKYYQRQVRKITRQNTIENTLDLLEDRFENFVASPKILIALYFIHVTGSGEV